MNIRKFKRSEPNAMLVKLKTQNTLQPNNAIGLGEEEK